MRRAGWIAALLLLAACRGEHQGPGTPSPAPLDDRVQAAQAERQRAAGRQILFGDLHAHTTFSMDAFVTSLPMMGGEGAHPPADACDYARFCAGLDFWSINDHAESITPQHWAETRQAIRQCNEVGDEGRSGPVAFLGWEWSQVGSTPDAHFGHKNVILRDTQEGRVPTRAIAAPRPEFGVDLPPLARVLLPLAAFSERQRYFDYFTYLDELRAMRHCPEGVSSPDLPEDCHEVAADPAELFRKLDEWGFASLVIPHGTTWGLMTPPGSSWDFQRAQHDPARQRLVELYSGHGNAEEARSWRAVGFDASGEPFCPAPTPDYEPCCWRAGEIVRGRCSDPASDDCEARVTKARRDHAASGVSAHRSVPGTTVEDWAGCGQCPDCFLPAYGYRPGLSVQAALASGTFRFGFIGSSDTHAARPGNGFKEHARRQLTEARAPLGRFARRMGSDTREPLAESGAVRVSELPLVARRYTERGNSMLLTGGLAAVHASERSRDAIWDALVRRETYATSGDRILLWFDLLNAPGGPVPMGSEVTSQVEPPRFRLSALGAFEQRSGCPPHVGQALSEERIERLCLSECHHPGERRRRIVRLELVRVTPARGDAPGRVEDPWQVVECPAGEEACSAVLEDPTFGSAGEVAYYARAIQEATPAVNGAGLRCETDERGRCVKVRPCYGDERTPLDDDCLAPVEERAWSSPIYVAP